jgi:RimJ/RimL family protein N-acetyltransferase
MMIEFIPFRPEHLAALRLQAAQAYLQPLLARRDYGAALAGPDTWTGIVAGRVIGCAGVLPQWPGRAIAWALLTRELTSRHFLRVHYKVMGVLDEAQRRGSRRIETSVDAGFDAGHRWARALGFRPEGLMRAYSPDGRDHVLYACVGNARAA